MPDPGLPAVAVLGGRLLWSIASSPTLPIPARPTPTATVTCRPRSRVLADPQAARIPAESSEQKRSGSPSPSHRSVGEGPAGSLKPSWNATPGSPFATTRSTPTSYAASSAARAAISLCSGDLQGHRHPARASLLPVPRQGPYHERPRTQVPAATGQGERTGGVSLGAREGANERSRAAPEPV